MQYLGKLPSIHTSMDSSVNPSVSLSITLSPSAVKPLKIPGNNGEKHILNYLHEITVKSPSVQTPYGMSVIAPVHASSIPSVHTSYIPCFDTLYVMSVHASSIEHAHRSCVMSVIAPISVSLIKSVSPTDDKHQEFLDEFPGTNYGEKNPSDIMAKIPDNITLTLHHMKFLEETPGTSNGVKYPANFPVTLKWVKFTVIN